jgi:tRNA(Ile2) C34 agmatinyltransferase TiaS
MAQVWGLILTKVTTVNNDNPRKRILRNAARCRTCGDEIESTSRHDFKTCSCGTIAVDGGYDYLKRSTTDISQLEELSEWE